MLFLGSLVSGAVVYYSLVNALFERPTYIPEILGATVPRQSFFFITFVLTEVSWALPEIMQKSPSGSSLKSPLPPPQTRCQAFIIRGFLNLLDAVPIIGFLFKYRAAEAQEDLDKTSQKIFPQYSLDV